MDLSLYRARSGLFVAVPDCIQPPFEIAQHHGPLKFAVHLQLRDSATKACPRLAHEIDAHNYALLSAEQATKLLDGRTDGRA